jgi:molybdenum cofactor guanylyltransferase
MSGMNMITAAILAGGCARRFGGRNKGTALVGGAPIVERQVEALRKVAQHLLFVGPRAGQAAAPDVPTVRDLVPGSGALGGIYTAIMAAPTERTLVVACDMPFLDARFLERLITVDPLAEVTIPRTADGLQPLCAVYNKSAASVLRQRIDAGRLKVTDALTELRLRVVTQDEISKYDPDGTLFFNVNTPDDHAKAARHAASVPGTTGARS